MKAFIRIVKNNIIYRKHILALAKADKKKKYADSDLGLFWAFAKPLMYVSVFYLAISLGLRHAKAIDGIITPYIVWLMVGMMAWFYMQSMLAPGAAVFKKYKIYITKINYPLEIVPSIMAISNFIIHIMIMGITAVICMAMGVMPSIYWLQLPFYMFFMIVFAVFWSLATGLISCLSRDFYHLIETLSQAFFWLSAIIFDVNGVPENVRVIFYFNPITYIIEGYRNSMCRHIWFFEEPEKLACYLFMLLLMIIAAVLSYRRLGKVAQDYL